jgi:sec-independent protein translocase protein TatC
MREDERADLVDHLEELRNRILRSIFYVLAAATAGWFLQDYAYLLLMRPITAALNQFGGKMVLSTPMEAFFVRVQLSFAIGLFVASPLVLYEIWGFVAPGLTKIERKAVVPLLPVSALLALAGASLAYLLSFRFFPWMLALAPPHVEGYFRLRDSILLMAKMLLAFAACFQMPIVLVFLVKAGIVSPVFLAARRREAIVGIVVLAAVATPSGDAITMMMLAVPLYLLYEGTLVVARRIERRQSASRRAAAAEGTPAPQ